MFFPDKTPESSFFLPPLGGSDITAPLPVSSVKLITDGATSLVKVVDLKFSKVPFGCLTSLRVLFFSSVLTSKSHLRVNTRFLKARTDSWIQCFNSFFVFSLYDCSKLKRVRDELIRNISIQDKWQVEKLP